MPYPEFTDDADVSQEYLPIVSFLISFILPSNTPIILHSSQLVLGYDSQLKYT